MVFCSAVPMANNQVRLTIIQLKRFEHSSRIKTVNS
jgi:hypothetical protein